MGIKGAKVNTTEEVSPSCFASIVAMETAFRIGVPTRLREFTSCRYDKEHLRGSNPLALTHVQFMKAANGQQNGQKRSSLRPGCPC